MKQLAARVEQLETQQRKLLLQREVSISHLITTTITTVLIPHLYHI